MADTGGIFHITPAGELVQLRQAPYLEEAVLQDFLARHPKLIPGGDIDAAEPRRFLLVGREVAIPGDDAGIGWIDHLFVDQDATPTFVEVKRATDTRIRREVVAQVLDYVSNAVVQWTGRDLGVVPEEVVHPGLLGGWWFSRPQSQGGHRMKLHANAALSLTQRRRMVLRVLEQGWSIKAAAAAAETSARTCGKWVARYRAARECGLLDRSSAPRLVANRTDERRIEAIAALRRLRFTGPEIAELLGMAVSTVSGILTRIGMGRLGRLGLEPAERYERERPGELIHIDVKKLGRIEGGAGKRVTGSRRRPRPHRTDAHVGDAQAVGWDYVHIAIDDATRLAYAEVLADEKASTAIAFLRRAVAFYRRHGITVERVMTDNGSAYRSAIHALACRALGIRHLRTRAHRPQTNGKAERFIRTMLAGWAYGAIYRDSQNAPQPLTAGSTTTTITDDTEPSAANRPSHG